MSKKKGFTLIEMLVVIAVIAVLVSIVIPTVSASTTRAAAAANAANLRAVEGKLNTLRLLNDKDYRTVLTGHNHLGTVVGDDSLFGQLLQQWAIREFATFEANANGEIVLPFTTIDALPAAKVTMSDGGLNSNTINCPEGTPMRIVITDTYIKASYLNYSLEHFADLAEDGKFDGKISNGVIGDAAENICAKYGHQFVNPLTGATTENCQRCGYSPCSKNHGAHVFKQDGHYCNHCGSKISEHIADANGNCTTSGCPYHCSYTNACTCNADYCDEDGLCRGGFMYLGGCRHPHHNGQCTYVEGRNWTK